MTFQALLLTQADGKTHAEIAQVDESQLPADGNVLVAVDYSTINFKDGLAITGRSPVVRKWPMVAGIDGAGTVLQSADPRWKAGDRVVLNGFGVGETHWGCLAQRAGSRASGWSAARRVHHAPGHGDRHGRLHGDAVGAGAGARRREWTGASRRWRCAGDRRIGRGGLGGDRGAVEARLSRDCIDGKDVGGRLPARWVRRR
jgi:hypothetical protein